MKGFGTVGAPGAPVAAWPEGEATVTVEWAKDDGGPTLCRCVYPDGFVKHHQVPEASVDVLLSRIMPQIKNRYGAIPELKSKPEALVDGATFTFGG